MKILYVNDYKERVGGTEVYLDVLSTHLRELGNEVQFYYGSDSYQNSLNNKKKLSSYLNRIFSFKHFFGFAKVVSDFEPDVIHFQNIFNELSPSILLQTKDIPVVMTLHDYFIVQAVFDSMTRGQQRCKKEICPGCIHCVGIKGMVYEKIKRFIHKFFLPRIDLFIAPSRYMQSVVSENSSFRPRQIYNGFELPDPLPFVFNHRMMYVGRLTKDKGVDFLVNAIPIIVETVPDFKLVVAGSGDLDQWMRKRVKELKVERFVDFLGSQTQKQIFKEYESCTGLVVSSNWPENLPTVCIESLSLGKPVVATHVGGIPEIVKEGQNGYLCEPRNALDIANAVIKLLSDERIVFQFSRNAVKSAGIFDINVHSQAILDCYKKVIKERNEKN